MQMKKAEGGSQTVTRLHSGPRSRSPRRLLDLGRNTVKVGIGGAADWAEVAPYPYPCGGSRIFSVRRSCGRKAECSGPSKPTCWEH